MPLMGLFATGGLSAWLAILPDPVSAAHIIRTYEYWILLIAVILFAVSVCAFLRTRQLSEKFLDGRWRNLVMPVVFVLFCSAILWLSQPQSFKIVMDEPILLSTSMSMHETRESATIARGYLLEGKYVPMRSYVDKRPALHPFILSVLHDLTGYRVTQGFWLNVLLAPCFFALLFMLGHRLWPDWGGYWAVCLMATVPLIAVNFSGSGFEILNLTILVAVCCLALLYWKEPSLSRQNLLVMATVLLAHVRYESALYVCATGVLILLTFWRERRVQIGWGVLVAPLLLITLPMHRTAYGATSTNQLEDKGSEVVFSLQYIPGNIRAALEYFFSYSVEQPASICLSIFFVAALGIALIVLIWHRKRIDWSSGPLVPGVIYVIVLLCNCSILMAYFWGQINEAAAVRLALPFILFQVLFCVAVFAQLPRRRSLGPVLLIMTIAYFAGFARPLLAQTDFVSHHHQLNSSINWFVEYLKANEHASNLYISNQNLIPVIYRKSAISLADAIRWKVKIDAQLRLGTFENILLFNFYPYDSSTLNQKFVFMLDKIDDHFETEIIQEEKSGSYGVLRLYRITGVKYKHSENTQDPSEQIVESMTRITSENFHLSLP